MMPFDRAISLPTAPAFDTAIELLRKSPDPVRDILRSSAYWIPLQFVYEKMVRNGDLVRLSDLNFERRVYYWNQVREVEKPKWTRINMAQALYVWEEINLK